MRLDARAIAIAKACDTLLPLVRTAREVFKRNRSMSAAELAPAVRGLREWATVHGYGYTAVNVAILIMSGLTAYDIVQRCSGTRRTSDRVKVIHTTWRARQLRRPD